MLEFIAILSFVVSFGANLFETSWQHASYATALLMLVLVIIVNRKQIF